MDYKKDIEVADKLISKLIYYVEIEEGSIDALCNCMASHKALGEAENHRHAKPVSAKDIEELIIEVNSRPEVCIEMYTAKDEAEAIINKYSVHERNE